MEYAPVPEDQIVEAETAPNPDHGHDGLTAADGTLVEHLRSKHGLDAPESLSAAAVVGLHDRLHDERHADVDPK